MLEEDGYVAVAGCIVFVLALSYLQPFSGAARRLSICSRMLSGIC
jgi:hypothetical protein